jgi:type IV secretory pathway VirB4 component
MPLIQVDVERSLAIRPKFLGLEITDLFLVGAVFGIAFSISQNTFLNLAIVAVCYAGLRIFKFNKPPNYTSNLFYYLGSNKAYTLANKDLDYIKITEGKKTVKKAKEQKGLKSFYNKINIWNIEDNCIVGLNEDYTAGFKIAGKNIFLVNENEATDIVAGIRGMLNNLTEKLKVQIIYDVDDGNEKMIRLYENMQPETEIEKLIFNSKLEALRNQKIRKVNIYFFITLKREVFKKDFMDMSVKFNNYKKIAEEERENTLTELNIILNRTKEYFASMKAEYERLTNEDLIDYVYSHLNPERKNIVNAPKNFNPELTAREQIAFSPAKPSWSYFFIDGYYCVAVNIKVPPESAMITDLKTIMELPFTYSLQVAFDVPVMENELNKLKRKVKQSDLIIKTSSKVNYEAQNTFDEQDSLLKEMQSSTQKLFNVSICVIVKDKIYSNLSSKVEAVIQAFTKLSNAQAIKFDSDHERLFLSFLPGHGNLNKLTFVFKTDALAMWLPMWQNWKGTDNLQALFKTDNNDLINFDFDDRNLNAKHKVIAGSTGKGKSFLSLYLLINFLLADLNNELTTIDIGPDYKFLNEVFDGSYFQVDLERDSLNLFPVKNEIIKGDNYDSDTIQFLATIIELLTSEKGDGLTKNELNIIEKCITYAYDNVDDDDMPILSNVETEMFEYKGRDDDDAKQARILGKALHYWTSGMYSKILNSKGGLNINNRVVSFDLSLLKAHPKLRDIVFFTINFMVLRKMQNKKHGRYQIVMDEFHEFGKNAIAAKLTEDLYRIGRKYNLDITTISQSPKDFIKHPAADAIMNNTFIKIFLNVEDGIDVIERFGMNDRETVIISELKSRPGYYSQAFMKYGSNSVILKIEPSSVDYWICTNNKNDNILKEEFNNVNSKAELLYNLAKKYPKGHFTLRDL